MRRTLRAVLATALVGGLALGAPPAGANPSQAGGTYLDDDAHTHEGMIEALTAQGTLRGCNTARTLVCPDDSLSRGQMASLLAQGLNLPPATRDHFPDDGGVHEGNINRLAEAGIAGGLSNGTFGGDQPVRREQLATFLAKARNLPGRPTGPFTDIAGVHVPAINAVAHAGITTGCDATGTRFCPGRIVTRAQAAAMLGRALGLTATPPPALTDASGTAEWCAVADRFVRTLSPADAATLRSYGGWVVGRQRPDRFPAGSLPLQLGTVSPFSGDPVVAGWHRGEGLLLDLAGLGDHQWIYPVDIEWSGTRWNCTTTAG